MTNAEVSRKPFAATSACSRIANRKISSSPAQFLLRKPYPSIEGFKAVFAELAEQIAAAKSADPKDFIDTRFLEELDRSGYIDGCMVRTTSMSKCKLIRLSVVLL